MKVKVILRAPKSQIPLYMTLNDAKFGNEQVTTSLNVVESNEVVQWVNNTTHHAELNISPQKQIEISQELASSLSKSLSEIFKNKSIQKKNIENRIKDVKNQNSIPYSRHKYKIAYLKDLPYEKSGDILNGGKIRNEEEINKSEDTDHINKAEIIENLDEIKDINNNETQDIKNSHKINTGNSTETKKLDDTENFNDLSNSNDVEQPLNDKKVINIPSFSQVEDFSVDKKDLINEPILTEYSKKELINDENNSIDTFKDHYENKETLDKFKSLLSSDFHREFSSMGVNLGTKYNGKEIKPNIRKKPIINSIFKVNTKNYDYNKKFKSNSDYRDILSSKNDDFQYKMNNDYNKDYFEKKNDYSGIDSHLIQKKVKKEIENAAKIEEMEKDIVKTFQNLTLTPYLYKKNISNNIYNRDYSLGDKQPPNEFHQEKNKTNLKVYNDKSNINLKNTRENDRNNNEIELSNALSRLNFELLNTNKVLDKCLNNGFGNRRILNDDFIKDSLKKLDNFEFFYKKMQLLFLDKPLQQKNNKLNSNIQKTNKFDLNSIDQFENTVDKYDDEVNNIKSSIDLNKIPNTNLPLLSEINHNEPKNSFKKNDLNKRSFCEDSSKRSSFEDSSKRSSFEDSSKSFEDSSKRSFFENPSKELSFEISSIFMEKKQDPKRSLSVPINEREFKRTPENINIDLKRIVEFDKNRNKSLNNNRINNKLPQSKIGLKPNLSLESLCLTKERGRTKIKEKNDFKITRDFVAENKSNVILNATKTSSSLQINLNKKNKISRKKSFNSKNTSSINDSISNKTHKISKEYRKEQEIYPSLEVGGPIARMNGTCGFIPCFQDIYNPYKLNFCRNEQINNNTCYYFTHQPKLNYLNTGYLDEKTPRCPYWCNLMSRN